MSAAPIFANCSMNIGAEMMKKLTAISRLARVTTVLMAGAALLAAADAASAKGDRAGNTQASGRVPQFAIKGQPVSAKRFLPDEKNGEKHADKDHEKKGCEHVTVPTPECGPGRHDPVGNTNPGGKTGDGTRGGSTTAENNPPKKPPRLVTISNGVKTVTVPDVPGQLSAAWSNAGGIDVHVGNQTIFMPGNSVTVAGEAMSIALARRGGLEEVPTTKAGTAGNERGISLTFNPPTPAAAPPKPARNNGGGDGVVAGTLKAIGNGIEDIGIGFINLGGPTPPKTSTVTQ
jgi:hypothetical protein